MDALINQYNFDHNDSAHAKECIDRISALVNKNRNGYDVQILLNSIEIIGNKLTQGHCPSYQSAGWNQADEVFESVMLICCKIEEGQQRDLLNKAMMKLMIRLLYDGPTTIHLQLIRHICYQLSDYTKSLQGQDVTDIIVAACSPINIKEDTPDTKIYETFKLVVTNILKQALEKEELTKKHNLIHLFHFIFHTYLDYPHLEKSSYVHVVKIGRMMHDYLSSSWKELDDLSVIRGLIQRINTSVKQPLFPYSMAAERSTRQVFIFISEITQKPGDAEALCSDVFDLLESISQCKTDELELILDMFDFVTRFFSQQKTNVAQNNTSLFKVMVPRFKKLLETADIKFIAGTNFALGIADVLNKAYAKNKELVPEWISLIVPLIKRPCTKTLAACNKIFRSDNSIQWKDHQGEADRIVEALNTIDIVDSSDATKEMCKDLTSCTSSFLRSIKIARNLKKYGEDLMFLCIQLLELKNERLYEMARTVAQNIEINPTSMMKDSMIRALKRLYTLLQNEDMPWLPNIYLYRVVIDFLEKTIHTFTNGKIFSDDDMRFLNSMCVLCLNQSPISPLDNKTSPYNYMANSLMKFLIAKLGSTKRLELAIEIIPLLIKYCDEDDMGLFQRSCSSLTEIVQFKPMLLAPFFDKLINIYLQKESYLILHTIRMVYAVKPKALTVHFQKMIARLFDCSNSTEMVGLAQILHEASKKQPELFTKENIKALVHLAINETSQQPMILQILQELAKRKPEKVISNLKLMISTTEWNPVYSSMLNDIVCTLALNVESAANEVIDYLIKSIRTNQEKGNIITALNAIRLIGFKYPNILKPKRKLIENLEITDPNGMPFKQTILDMIDGKTPKELQTQLNEQKEALTGLVNRVDDVEGTLVEMDEELAHQGVRMDNISNEVTEQGQRIDEVEETVEETVLKVEGIDGKTLSHAPYWSRDVSKLLNPQTEHDWRLLSTRLGYTNADIRGWAQQADPCMAMLNEWYATRKTSEATLAILTHLQEMDRMDAAIIVENAMKNAEAVVEDEDFEYAAPPPIFISYQWGHQEEVKLLKQHLEMAGYECWMDIGQMGGGDKLFEKIDLGIRACKVVISCVTSKYTKSPNCNREVNLSVGLNKPIIPLLMEQCSWPPPGSMGPIFSESLFIRFFQRKGEETTDQRYWSEPKFLELLMQLNMNEVPPDEAKIQPVYKDWWMPIEQEITIDKSKTRDGGQASQAVKKDFNDVENECPDVFISYQWGKQKNVIKLYQSLTSMGFSCWLDIKQMGGGDSLYDKIDRGIRGSKLVLSCVTQKYSLSANCRREVSLADALKKPLLPLLLEKMTWPPPGPMSMVMTQLLYIQFTEEQQQDSWQGPQFDELISKINQHIPNVVNIQPTKKITGKPVAISDKKADIEKKADREEKADKGQKADREEKADKGEKADTDEKADQKEKADKEEKADTEDKADKKEKADKDKKADKEEKADKKEKAGLEETDKKKKADKGKKTDKEEKAYKEERADTEEKADKEEKTGTEEKRDTETSKDVPETLTETNAPQDETGSEPAKETNQDKTKPKAVIKPLPNKSTDPPPPPPPQAQTSPPPKEKEKSKTCSIL